MGSPSLGKSFICLVAQVQAQISPSLKILTRRTMSTVPLMEWSLSGGSLAKVSQAAGLSSFKFGTMVMVQLSYRVSSSGLQPCLSGCQNAFWPRDPGTLLNSNNHMGRGTTECTRINQRIAPSAVILKTWHNIDVIQCSSLHQSMPAGQR